LIRLKKQANQILIIKQNYILDMRKFLEPINDRNREGNPENGATRIQKTSDSSLHLQIFYNGSWRHDVNCKIKTNKECIIKV
jgi:hypothetical protein